jgi:hypothetical protein
MILVLFYQESSAIQYRNKGLKTSSQTYPWAFQIALDGQPGDDAGNNGIQGIRFSIKRHTSKFTAYRFNLGFLGHEEYYNDYDLFYNDNISIKFDNGRKFDFTGVNISAQYLYYPSPDKNIQIFWGAGPRLSINETNPDLVYIYYGDWYDAVECSSSTRLGLGAEASLGAEWFLGRSFSLLAEWGVILQNEWYLFELDHYGDYYHYVNQVETVNDGLHLDASRLKLGVSFYF